MSNKEPENLYQVQVTDYGIFVRREGNEYFRDQNGGWVWTMASKDFPFDEDVRLSGKAAKALDRMATGNSNPPR